MKIVISESILFNYKKDIFIFFDVFPPKFITKDSFCFIQEFCLYDWLPTTWKCMMNNFFYSEAIASCNRCYLCGLLLIMKFTMFTEKYEYVMR